MDKQDKKLNEVEQLFTFALTFIAIKSILDLFKLMNEEKNEKNIKKS